MKLLHKIGFICLLSALITALFACVGNGGNGGGDLFKDDPASLLAGTGETGGPVNFISRVAAFDLFAPSDVVVRVKLEGGFDRCEITKKVVPSNQATYKNGKLVLAKAFFEEWYTKRMERALAVYDKQGRSAEIPLVIADKIIYTAEEFQMINTNAASLSGYYVLGADIDFEGGDYTMLGCITNDGADEGTNPFNGLLEGAGFTVSNVNIRQISSDPEDKSNYIAGLIKVVGGAGIVRNLSVKGVSVKVGGGISGGLVGLNKGKISDCYVESDVAPIAYNEPSGGFVGFNAEGEISNCVAYTRVDGLGFCGGNFRTIRNSVAVAKSGSRLSELGGMLHVDAENPPYDVGFEVLNQFACDMFEYAATSGCAVYEDAGALKTPSNFAAFSGRYWDISANGIKLYKMFLPNS